MGVKGSPFLNAIKAMILKLTNEKKEYVFLSVNNRVQ